MSPSWSYENQNVNNEDQIGPEKWSKYYQTGQYQSPINILVHDCIRSNHSHPTCCSHNNKDNAHNNKHMNHSSCNNNNNNQTAIPNIVTYLRQTHLDSIGEDEHHQRSSSTSSSRSTNSESSSNSSPIVPTNDETYDDYELTKIQASSKRIVSCPKSNLKQNTRYCFSNKKIFLGYPRYMSNIKLCNTGHSWQINIPHELAAHTLLSGPSFGDREYRLAQLHCHWGKDCDQGSEHQINGNSYSAEIHFVHWNCTDFRSVEEASKHKHGLAVLGVFVMALEGEQNKNKHLDKIVTSLKRIKNPGSSIELETKLDLKKLFPANRWLYASYEGSLTTPPLSEVVDWVVFLNPIICSTNQVEQFQRLEFTSHGRISGKTSNTKMNCRPVQPTNNRLVSIWAHATS